MAEPFSPAQKRFIATEIAIGTVLGSVLPATMMYLTFDPFPMAMWGGDGFALFLIQNAFGMGTVMTLLMTLAVRMRVGKGRAPALAWTRADSRLLRGIPRAVLLRAPLFGLGAVAVPGMVGLAVAVAIGFDAIERLPFAIFIGLNSALVALCLIPFILIGAMSDRAAPSTMESAT